MAAARPPQHHHPGPTLAPTSFSSSSSNSPIDFSPPLIAMVIVAAAAFLFITYSRVISRHLFPPFIRFLRHHRRRRFLRSPSDFGSPTSPPMASTFTPPTASTNPSSKTFPSLSTSFPPNLALLISMVFMIVQFVSLISKRARVFALCLIAVTPSTSSVSICGFDLTPRVLSAELVCTSLRPRILLCFLRPSFDEGVLMDGMFLEPLPEVDAEQNSGEIQEIFSPERRVVQSEDHRSNRRELDFLLKRSYSFGFERMVMEAATTPYHHRHRRSFFWSKRPSSSTPFSSLAKSRVFSFRRTMKSPAFFRRKGYFPMTEWSESLQYGSSSRRMKAMACVAVVWKGEASVYSSSRMRSGDPEALISPERYNRR